LFALEAEILRLPAKSPDEKIRFFLVASVLDRLATSLDRSAGGEAGTEDYRVVLSLIERALVAASLGEAEQIIVDLITIVGPKARPTH